VPLQRMFDAGTPAGLQYYVKSDFLTGLNPDALHRPTTHKTTRPRCATRAQPPTQAGVVARDVARNEVYAGGQQLPEGRAR
jgi:hypothetical protein